MVEKSERLEALWRILVAIVVGVILYFWNYLMMLVVVVHWLYAVITGKRSKDLADFANTWASYMYRSYRYLSFTTNARPWPFTDFQKPMEDVDFKASGPKKANKTRKKAKKK
ncbi:DUF4389 domain-containing protein [Candidatus Woesearchaeota archaeon]|nr:DUF4389 domain-containing protein [Candidatus Woesearchaeota archaeon]